MMEYVIKRAEKKPELDANWESPQWADANVAEIANFRPESSGHRPETKLKLLYDDRGIYGKFKVTDKYVRSVITEFQGAVCTDSCVEFFAGPDKFLPDDQYLNFEFNCGGTFLVYYIQNPARDSGGLAKYHVLTKEEAAGVEIYHSMPEVVEPEITEETEWYLGFFIPFSVYEQFTGPLPENPAEVKWHGNFYKCGDKTSHPHWASWSPVDELNFHLPSCFQTIKFAE